VLCGPGLDAPALQRWLSHSDRGGSAVRVLDLPGLLACLDPASPLGQEASAAGWVRAASRPWLLSTPMCVVGCGLWQAHGGAAGVGRGRGRRGATGGAAGGAAGAAGMRAPGGGGRGRARGAAGAAPRHACRRRGRPAGELPHHPAAVHAQGHDRRLQALRRLTAHWLTPLAGGPDGLRCPGRCGSTRPGGGGAGRAGRRSGCVRGGCGRAGPGGEGCSGRRALRRNGRSSSRGSWDRHNIYGHSASER